MERRRELERVAEVAYEAAKGVVLLPVAIVWLAVLVVVICMESAWRAVFVGRSNK